MQRLLTTACAVVLPLMAYGVEPPVIESVEPQSVVLGKATDISIGVSAAAQSPLYATLSPGGPQPLTRFSFAEGVRDIVVYKEQLIIAAGAAGLLTRFLDDKNHGAGESRVLSDINSLAVRIAGDTAYVLSGDREMLIFDLSRPIQSAPLSRYPLRDDVKDYAAGDGLVALLYRDNELVVVNTENPAKIRQTINIRPEDTIDHIVIHKGFVFAATTRGLLTFDLRDPAQFGAAGIFRMIDGAGVLAKRDDLLLVASRRGGLTVIDVSDPQAPRWLASHHRVGVIKQIVVQGDDALLLRENGALLLLDIALPAMPTIVSGYKPKGNVQAVTLDRRQAMVAMSSDVVHVDFSAEPPSLSNELLDIGQGVNFGGQRRAFIDGNIVYVADWFSGIHIYDISAPDRPRLLSSFHTPGSPKGVVVKNGIAYVADDDHGLQVLDVQDPRHPRQVGNLPINGLAYTPKISGDLLYLASHRGGFQVIDIAVPHAPRLLGEYDTPGKAWSLDIKDGFAFVADDDAGLLVFDVHDPAQPLLVGSFVPGGQVEEIVVGGNYAYITSFNDGVYILDISRPDQPQQIAHLATPGNARGLDLHGKKLYVADWLAGIHIVDVSQPEKPEIIASYDTDGAAWGIRVAGEHAVVLDWWGGLVMLDVTDPASPRLSSQYSLRGRISQISALGNFLVTAHGAGGLQVFDINNALNPTWVTTVELASDAMRLSVFDDVAYVALRNGAIAIIDLRNPFEANQIGTLEYTGDVERMQAAGHWLYVLDRSTGLAIFDTQQRRRPVRIGGYPGRINDFFTDGTALFTAMPNREILVFDAADPQNLLLKQRVQLAYEPARLTATKEHLVSYDQQQLSIFSRRESSIIPTGLAMRLNGARSVVAKGGQLFATVADGEFLTWNVSSNATPIPGATYTLANPVDRVFVYRDVAYFAGSEAVTAVQLLPATRVMPMERDRLHLSVSPALPLGAYDLLITSADGSMSRKHNAITVQMPRFSKPKFSLDDLEKALQQRQFNTPPAAP
ncbi:MAG: LVIVD repeat-containing protein [Gammaproteobacteria bacterium]|nr:MAG: LVIVD repeat-containing protein [Gammaproteobacteria bacterium]TND03956.1 MAG: LVIVD repeat-containing protein [Gammaproteobacteria bacterium]